MTCSAEEQILTYISGDPSHECRGPIHSPVRQLFSKKRVLKCLCGLESLLQSYFCLWKYIVFYNPCLLLWYSCGPLVLFLFLLYLVLDSPEGHIMKWLAGWHQKIVFGWLLNYPELTLIKILHNIILFAQILIVKMIHHILFDFALRRQLGHRSTCMTHFNLGTTFKLLIFPLYCSDIQYFKYNWNLKASAAHSILATHLLKDLNIQCCRLTIFLNMMSSPCC